jgi:ribosomal protein S18 acetylase RimI-like enzyme
MDALTAWQIFLTGITDTAFGRVTFRRFRDEPCIGIRFAKPGDNETSDFDEYFVATQTPAEVLTVLAADQVLASHYITVLQDGPSGWAANALPGYQLRATERLMARPLDNLPSPDQNLQVSTVADAATATWLNANDPTGRAWIALPNVEDPNVLHAYIRLDERPVARGATVRCGPYLYVTAIHTHEAYRQRGLARAVMLHLLAEGARTGATWSVLTSSVAGEILYQRLGYTALGSLLIFEPTKQPIDESS